MKKNSPGHFDKFAKKKSNAAIKEQFKQEKRKWRKEREEFFDRKKSEVRNQKLEGQFSKETTSNFKSQTSNQQMPLNKFIAHGGVCSRRDAAELVKLGKVKV